MSFAMKNMQPINRRKRSLLVFALMVSLSGIVQPIRAQEEAVQTSGKFITVTSPIDDTMSSRIHNLALELQNDAEKEDREVVMVLEISPGTSSYGQVHDLAKFLTSSKLSKVRTVAWVPNSVTGNNVILALACNEIVMHPDAELGDIGRGGTVDEDEQRFVLSLVKRRHNRLVSPGLAKGMMSRAVDLKRVELDTENGGRETRILTREDVVVLQNAETPICLLYTSPSPRDQRGSRMPSSA